jgi:2-methylcitrate dehydratase PrpD
MTKRCVLDAVGCALAGVKAEQVASLVRRLSGGCPDEGSPVWGAGVTTSLSWSIFLNACSASYFDLDDGHRLAQGHPGAAVIPAALSVAGYLGCSGRAFLEAVVCGYEVAIRSALAMRALGGPRKGSGAWVTTGVAASIAKLLNLKPKEILDALGLAEFFAPQAPQDRSSAHPSFMKEGIPWGAYTGHMAAFLASNRLQAMRPFLCDAPAIRNLGETYEIERIYFKRYAACRFIHPVLDGLVRMKEQRNIAWTEIDRIDIRTFEKGILLDRRNPHDPVAAVYSYPFAVASYLRHGRLGPGEVSGSALLDPQIRDLARRIRLKEDGELTALFPERCLARMEVTFKDGEHYESGLLSAKGDPEDPLAEQDLLAKFRFLVEPVYGQQWRSFPRIIDGLDKEDASVSEIIGLLSAGGNAPSEGGT